MAAPLSSRAFLNSALIALVLAYPAYAAFACSADSTHANGGHRAVADNSQTDKSQVEKNKAERDCRKRTEGQRTPSGKPCPDGGERLPQDKRSPLDSLPPLAPLVA
jgi:hypothetical protein